MPRIAVVHTWVNTQNEGWYRLALDEMKVPYTYISDQAMGKIENLRDKFDVILYPPGAGGLSTMINGIPKLSTPDGGDFGGPIPWKHTDLTPNLATADGQPDQTDDIRGGMGFMGLAHLKKFIDDGGLFIPITSVAQLPIDLGMTNGISIAATPQLQARGSIYMSNVEDRTSPIAYGYDETLGVYFSQAPVLRVSLGLGGGGGGAPGGEELAVQRQREDRADVERQLIRMLCKDVLMQRRNRGSRRGLRASANFILIPMYGCILPLQFRRNRCGRA